MAEELESLRGASRRIAVLGDSQVAAGCLVKGRSSSPALNLELQPSRAILLGSDAYLHYVWIPTHANPADDPARDKPVRPPARISLEWMNRAAVGDFRLLNELVTREDALSRESGRPLPDLEAEAKRSLPPAYALDIRPCRQHITDCAGPALLFLSDHIVVDDHLAVGSLAQVVSASAPQPRGRPTASRAIARACPGPALPSIDPQKRAEPPLCLRAVAILLSFPKEQFELRPAERRDPLWTPCVAGAFDSFLRQPQAREAPHTAWSPLGLALRNLGRPSAPGPSSVSVRSRLFELIFLQAVGAWGAGPTCSSFSVAATPPVRTIQWPGGAPWSSSNMRAKCHDGNRLAAMCASLASLSLKHGVHFWIGNPSSSWLWRQKPFLRLRRSHAVGFSLLSAVASVQSGESALTSCLH